MEHHVPGRLSPLLIVSNKVCSFTGASATMRAVVQTESSR